MGSVSTARKRLLGILVLCGVGIGVLVALASAAGPGGWDHLGETPGAPPTDSLNLVASALEVTPGAIYVGGKFTDAGGIADADRIAKWNGSSWSAVSSSTEQITNGEVFAIAVAGDKVYAGGTFSDAGGSGADNLAVWNGTSWEPFCILPGKSIGNVKALQVVGSTLYVGGDFQDGGGVLTADYLLACDLATGAPSDTIADPAHPFSGPVKALTATSNGRLYAGGRFGNLENIPAADNVAFLDCGGWHPRGAGAGACTCALDAYVRGLGSNGTDVYVGTEGSNVDGLAQADHVAKWSGSAWSAMGSNTGGTDGWFPAGTNIHDLVSVGPNVFATGTFQNANGEPLADNIAWFDGSKWRPVGSNGAGNGPWVGEGSALAIVGQQLYAAGNFSSAGGDLLAGSVASFSLSQIIAQPTPTVTASPNPGPTPTVTPGPSAVPTPTVTPSPTTAGNDIAAPRTSLRRAQVNQVRRKATFRFASSEPGSTFVCKLDGKRFRPCASPKTYRKLEPGTHVFRVKARDRARNVDATPAVKRFRISRR
jgi:trimeric autotransporter adhesin